MDTPRAFASEPTVPLLGLSRAPSSIRAIACREMSAASPSRSREASASNLNAFKRSPNVSDTTTSVTRTTNVVKLHQLRPMPVYRQAEPVKLHERLEKVRALHHGASLEDLAEKAGLTRQALQRWVQRSKAGASPGRAETLARCADVWKVDMEWLQTGRGEPRPNSLDPLERALAEEEWSEAAKAAAKAHHRSGARYELARWVTFLRRVHDISATSDPPSGSMRASEG